MMIECSKYGAKPERKPNDVKTYNGGRGKSKTKVIIPCKYILEI